ncbi:EAL domain-containing protein [Marinobacter sp. NSM]|uniref:EAL domain-containing protein n=1 Tax=Marinobacter sp. NSM TaxID=3458004 RepID=UPI0040363566
MTLSSKLLSKPVVAVLFLLITVLLAMSLATYVKDRSLQSNTFSSLRIASWSLAQMGREASALNLEVALAANGAGSQERLQKRYDILWSRLDYILNSPEASVVRSHADNKQAVDDIFRSYRALEPMISALIGTDEASTDQTVKRWQDLHGTLQRLITDNFVGDETAFLAVELERSRDRLANLRFFTLSLLLVTFAFLAAAVFIVRKQNRLNSVTGLPNRETLRNVKKAGAEYAVICLEIADFDLVLSDFGTEAGDALQRDIAAKLRGLVDSQDEIIHKTPESFVVLTLCRSRSILEDRLRSLREVLSFDWRWGSAVTAIRPFMGVDPSNEGLCPDWTIRYQRAHRALVQAKLENERVVVSQEDLRKKIDQERRLHAELLRAFNREPSTLTLSLVYQPIVPTNRTRFVTGSEVLLRCYDRNYGFIPPNELVAICEKFGLGEALGQWIFSRVVEENADLYVNQQLGMSLSINVSPSMLSPRLVGDVRSILLASGIPGDCLYLEITEDNAALEFERINKIILELKDAGVRFALDDFGTGHSSLEYVRELKIDRIKIDRCFVDGIDTNPSRERFLNSIISMADTARLNCVVEGVETLAQLEIISNAGDCFVQGYFINRPMTSAAYRQLLLAPDTEVPDINGCLMASACDSQQAKPETSQLTGYNS